MRFQRDLFVITIAILVAIAASVLLSAGPVEAADPALIEAAKREGQVRWYTVLVPEAREHLVAAFERRYPGIKIEAIREVSKTVSISERSAQKVIAEAKAGKPLADVFDGTETAGILVQAGLTQPYKADSAVDIPGLYKDPDGNWTAMVLYFKTVGYNGNLVPEGERPKTFEDLLDPKWRGKMVWSETAGMSNAPGFVGNILMTMGQKDGMAFLEKLKRQDVVKITADSQTVLKEVAEGKYALGLHITNHQTLLRRAEGFNVGWIKMEPLMSYSNNIGLVKNAPHPSAGKLFIDFALSVEGQTALSEGSHLPTNSKVPGPDPTLKSGFKVNFVSPSIIVQQMGEWQAVFDKMFKQ